MSVPLLIEDLKNDSSWKSIQKARVFLRGTLSRTDRIALASFLTGSGPRSRSDYPKRSVRVALCSDSSLENLSEPLAIRLLERGLFCEIYESPYGQLAQEVRDPAAGLIRHQADVIVLAPLTNLWTQLRLTGISDAQKIVDEVWSHVDALRKSFSGIILMVNVIPPESRPHGILEPRRATGQADLARSINLALSERCRTSGAAYLVDADLMISQSGVRWATFHKQQFMAGRSWPDDLAARVAVDIAGFCAALKGFARKCLALDLDNTLWGGVVGEEGWQGVKIGGSYPGNVYSELQYEIRQLQERGVALALISKNNEADAWEVFERRSEMVLKRSDITTHRINWNDKAQNLRELATELNLGLDAFVVLDDNPVERSWIEDSLPEVEVCPAGDPLEMLRWLTTTARFDTLAITQEDRLRQKSYAAAEERAKLASSSTNLDEYLATLGTVIKVGELSPTQLSRVAQLTQKTNQFNLTTRRYSETEMQECMVAPNWHIYWCHCRDRFADEGVIGVAVAVEEEDYWKLDTFLMSCRVLGRGVEKAFLQFVIDEATRHGAAGVRGEFIRTLKNGQTEEFLQTCGFESLERSSDHGVWVLSLPSEQQLTPPSILVETARQSEAGTAAN
jgi:FkbH-like protein